MPGYNLPKNMNENIGHFIIRQEAANNSMTSIYVMSYKMVIGPS